MSDIAVDVSLNPALSVDVNLQQPVSVPVTLASNTIIEVGVVATGKTGPANSLSIGTVTTGAAGSSASATITGTAPAQVLDLTIPSGNPGTPGSAATIATGTTTTTAPGTSASVSNSGTSSAAILDFSIPAGAVWYTGTGTPSTLHNNGDLYLNTSNGAVYKQTAGAWGSPIANLTGPQGSAGAASGADTQVQFNDGGVFAGDAGLTFNKTTNALTVAGTLSASNVSGTNTGDQDLSGLVPKTTTVNGYALSANVALNNTDVGAAATSHTHVATTDLTATGTKSSTTYLRGDNTWQTPPNTTYTAMTVAEGQTGTATTSRAMRADYNKQIIQYHVQQALLAMNADVQYGWPVPS